MRRGIFLWSWLLTVACLAGFAQGDFIVQPVAAQADSVYGPSTNPQFVITGAGLSDPSAVETNDPVPATWPSHSTAATNVNWLSAASTGEALRWIEFDLGQAFALSGLHVWNNNQASQSDRGFRTVDILTSLDGAAYFTVADDYVLSKAPESDTYAGETYWLDLGPARYVRIQGYKSENWGDTSYIGLSEVRLIALPEPATAALLFTAGAGLVLRRRRLAATARRS